MENSAHLDVPGIPVKQSLVCLWGQSQKEIPNREGPECGWQRPTRWALNGERRECPLAQNTMPLLPATKSFAPASDHCRRASPCAYSDGVSGHGLTPLNPINPNKSPYPSTVSPSHLVTAMEKLTQKINTGSRDSAVTEP